MHGIGIKKLPMKEYGILSLPFFVPILFGMAYSPLNKHVLVERFGCGCKLEGINTNHITLFVFLFLLIANIVWMCFLARKLCGWKRWAYTVGGILVQIVVTNFMMMRETWM
jgi:hypothetical protein